MKDFACRKWCTDPASPQWAAAERHHEREWHAAQLVAFREANPDLRPKVPIAIRPTPRFHVYL